MLYILSTDTCYGLACEFHDIAGYEKIYKFKKRDKSKALAIMVKSFEWLEKNTDLSSEQIDFLKKYDRPFTILTESSAVRLYLEFESESGEHFFNKNIYSSISFRVAHTPAQKKLISQVGPLWLTSANLSDTKENYSIKEVEKDFGNYIADGNMKIIDSKNLNPRTPPSDVFRFVDDTLEIEYIRKA